MTLDPGWSQAEQAILGLFKAEWVTGGTTPRTPVAWPNAPGGEPTTAIPWVRISLLWAGAESLSIGPRRDRFSGVITVQCFAAIGVGQAIVTQLCDAAATIFRGRRVLQAGGAIRCFTPSLTVVGGDGRWWQQNVSTPFTRDRV